jgi:hypothetical protein
MATVHKVAVALVTVPHVATSVAVAVAATVVLATSKIAAHASRWKTMKAL